jgi:hypothetical protein
MFLSQRCTSPSTQFHYCKRKSIRENMRSFHLFLFVSFLYSLLREFCACKYSPTLRGALWIRLQAPQSRLRPCQMRVGAFIGRCIRLSVNRARRFRYLNWSKCCRRVLGENSALERINLKSLSSRENALVKDVHIMNQLSKEE